LKLALRIVAVAAALAAAYFAGRLNVGGKGIRVRTEEWPTGGLSQPTTFVPSALAPGPVRSAILLVADGMGVLQSSAGALRAFGVGGRFLFERLPATGLVTVHPHGGLYPSSDSTATALASGRKTRNGRIGLAPDGSRLHSIVESARDRGMPTGLVTTSHIYDATPAAFAAHVARRAEYAEIVDQLAVSGVDLLAGGGIGWFRPLTLGGRRTDGRDLLAEAEARGITVVRTVEGLAAADRLPLWALFPGKRLGDSPVRPNVGDLAERAIELISDEANRRDTGFLLVIEEEGVDTWSHEGRLEGVAKTLLRFERAVAAAVDFAARDAATLVVVVGDHSTGSPIVGRGSDRNRLRVIWGSESHTTEPVPIYAYGPPQAAARFNGVMDNTDVARRLAELLGLPLAGEEGGRR
jgi:alkaline phosphatase